MTQGAAVLAEEYFDSGDPRFLEAFRDVRIPDRVAAMTDRWFRDPRPWAREQAIAYFEEPLSTDGHHPVLKRWLRHAESTADTELMGVLMVACDGLVRREFQWGQFSTPRNSILPPRTYDRKQNKWRKREWTHGKVLYSYATRRYLRRRAWRWFRKIGHQSAETYVAAVASALSRYTDAALEDGPAILDSWSLLHACFFHSPLLEFDARRAQLTDGSQLADLEPAPAFPELWSRTESFPELASLIVRASSRLVRTWAIRFVRANHQAALAALDIATIVRWIGHDDTEIQEFGIACLENHEALPTLRIDDWKQLLAIQDPLLLQRLCELMQRHVRADRIDDTECVALTTSRPTPIARLGLSLLQPRELRDPGLLVGLADARCEAVGAAVAEFALKRLSTDAAWNPEACMRFLDSANPAVRVAAWAWLLAHDRASRESMFFVRLIETPHDDMRLPLIDELERRAALPGLGGDTLVPVWSSVLLGVHRGGRRKPKAVRQIANAIIAEPERVDALLPVLCVAVRSVRGPERAAGLSALATVAAKHPALHARIEERLPGLSLPEATR